MSNLSPSDPDRRPRRERSFADDGSIEAIATTLREVHVIDHVASVIVATVGRQRSCRDAELGSANDPHGSGPVLMRLDEVGDRDGWRCWLCDEAVDPDMSVNDPRGPSMDSRTTERKAKAKGKGAGKGAGTGQERLAHRSCNTGKGSTKPVIEWPAHLFVADPAVILTTVDRLQRKGGREIVGRCLEQADARAAAEWIVDRISRLEPGLTVSADVDSGGGQFLVVLETER